MESVRLLMALSMSGVVASWAVARALLQALHSRAVRRQEARLDGGDS